VTLELESWLWDLFQSARGPAVSPWERDFLADNEKRYAEDRNYFVSAKMAQILVRIDDKI
jgi:hypothetical protein